MLQSFHKALRSSSQSLNLPTHTLTPSSSPSKFQPPPTSPSLPLLTHQCRLSRRELTICTNSCLLLLLGAQGLLPLTSRAEENLTNTDQSDQPQENLAEENLTSTTKSDQPEENLAKENLINTTGSDQPEESLPTNATDQPEENLADENLTNTNKSDEPEESLPTNASGCTERKPTKTVFFDISIDGEPAGRITIGLYGEDVPTGVERFSKIVSGATGISYRRKEFIKIMPNYVQHGGLRSYGVDAELAKGKGSNLETESLVEEWERTYERCPETKNLAGSVGLIVRDPSKPPPKLKLVARKGKLEIDQEEVGIEPNGTEFVIAIKDSPELDASALVIGRVVGGVEVVQKIGQVKTVQENTSSPYFRVAKLIGDKRAVVAERGFNRPYSKVVITNCGVLE